MSYLAQHALVHPFGHAFFLAQHGLEQSLPQDDFLALHALALLEPQDFLENGQPLLPQQPARNIIDIKQTEKPTNTFLNIWEILSRLSFDTKLYK